MIPFLQRIQEIKKQHETTFPSDRLHVCDVTNTWLNNKTREGIPCVSS